MTDFPPLVLTPSAQAGTVLPSDLMVRQIHMLLRSGVTWEQLDPNLRSMFLLGYYLGNVRNGGHSQFIGNAFNFYNGSPVLFVNWAMDAAEQYSMPDTLKIMREFLAWISTNPEEASKQTGFTPHVSPELRPFDDALLKADTIDEDLWLARVASLPKAYSQTFLRRCSYDEGFVTFPAIFSDIEELRRLANFQPVRIVAEDNFDEEIRSVALEFSVPSGSA